MANAKDGYFGPEFIDADEWREEPVPHRYVHGGFQDTDTRFSLCFPSVEKYEGRFLQHLAGGLGGTEHAQGMVSGLSLAMDCGAYLVESNQGHNAGAAGPGVIRPDVDQAIIGWRASVETARLSKKIAADMYGNEPEYGYIFGGSGGGARVLNCIERTGMWNGAVPFIVPSPGDIFRLFPIIINASRILRPVLDKVADAVAVGGSGNPFIGLSSEQAEVLLQAYKAGFPRDMPLKNSTAHIAFFAFFSMLKHDREYLDDFWQKPGYLGADHPEEFADILIDVETTVTDVLSRDELRSYTPPLGGVDWYGRGEQLRRLLAMPAYLLEVADFPTAPGGFRINTTHTERLGRSTVTVLSGKAAGQEFDIDGVLGDVLVGTGSQPTSEPWFECLAPGDTVRISNRNYLACCYYSRYLAKPGAAESQSITLDGKAIYPQRDKRDVIFAAPFRHDIGNNKVIMIQNMCDTGTWPRFAAKYYEQLKATMGVAADENFRLYFIEHAEHVPIAVRSRLIDYSGYVRQAVRDLIAWVEHGKEPARSSRFAVTADNAVVLAPDAATRCGIQPVVEMRANGGIRTQIAPGDTVLLEVEISLPSGEGVLTTIEWDPLGDGTFPLHDDQVDGAQTKIRTRIKWPYDTPGTYFPAVRVITHRRGTANKALYQLPNLGRARVVVQ